MRRNTYREEEEEAESRRVGRQAMVSLAHHEEADMSFTT